MIESSSSAGANQGLYEGYVYIRNDLSTFELFKSLTHDKVGILIPPRMQEVSDSTLREILQDTVKEGVTSVVIDVSKQQYETGDSYAKRIHRYAQQEGISKIVIFGLAKMYDTATYDTADTLEEAVDKLLRS